MGSLLRFSVVVPTWTFQAIPTGFLTVHDQIPFFLSFQIEERREMLITARSRGFARANREIIKLHL